MRESTRQQEITGLQEPLGVTEIGDGVREEWTRTEVGTRESGRDGHKGPLTDKDPGSGSESGKL